MTTDRTDHAATLRVVAGCTVFTPSFAKEQILEAAAELDRLRARIAELEADRMDLLNLIIQPWTREGDGARLFKINLAWWETAESREQAMMLVRDASAALKATVVPAGNLREPEQ